MAAAKQQTLATLPSRVRNDAASFELSTELNTDHIIPSVITPPDWDDSDDGEGGERGREYAPAELQNAVRSIGLRREGSPYPDSSDDGEGKKQRLEYEFAELQNAIRSIGTRRNSSPDNSGKHVQLHAQAVHDPISIPDDSQHSATYVRALYSYEGASSRLELSLCEGNIIRVLNKLDSGWWDGMCGGARGWFPSSYCVELHAPDEESYRSSQVCIGRRFRQRHVWVTCVP